MGPRRWRTPYYKSRSYTDDVFDVPGSSSELDLRARWFVASHNFPPRDAIADYVSPLLFGRCSFPAVVVHQGRPQILSSARGTAQAGRPPEQITSSKMLISP